MPARTRRPRPDDSAVSPVIGTILMVAITVTLAAVVFVLVQRLSDDQAEPAPTMTFAADESDGELQLLMGPVGSQAREWGNMTVTGCVAPTGAVDAGDTLTSCSGTVTIVDRRTNTVVYRGEF